jgi:diaminopropionate ammonia-lyase
MGGEFLLNPSAAGARSMNATEDGVLAPQGFAAAHDAISAWPDYQPTPLRGLPALARTIGVDALYYKDEASRFGLGSFKALGGAYAVQRLVEDGAGDTFATATDGNHGRAVAWGARRFGRRAVVYIHETVSEGRAEAIRALGAEVVRTPGNYDDSVRQAAADAERHGWTVVSDTSWEGYAEIPRLVMYGYGVMVAEALRQAPRVPTHIFVQAGVGALAAAVCAVAWQEFGAQRPRLIVVEPERAACLFESGRRGRLAPATGDTDSLMAGLACGEASPLAWDLLRTGADAFMIVPDDDAVQAMRRLAMPLAGDPAIVAGESAVAGLCGLMRVCQDARLKTALGLDANARVLLFGTEGATDPDLYRRLVSEAGE